MVFGGNYDYRNFFYQLESLGMTDALLPFLFVFVIIFAILEKSHILGDDKRRFNAVIAFVIGMFVVVPHITGTYPPGWDVIEIMKGFLPGVSAVIIAFVMMLILIGLFGGRTQWEPNAGGWVAVLAFIVIVFVFGAAAGWWQGWDWLTNFLGEDAVAIIIMLLVFGIIVAYILSPDNQQGRTKFFPTVGGFFSGPGTGHTGTGTNAGNPPRT